MGNPLPVEVLCCPQCQGALGREREALACAGCRRSFGRNRQGYFEFILDPRFAALDTTSEEYASTQEEAGYRLYRDFLANYISQEPGRRVLDVGCGLGRAVAALAEAGYEACGIDLPCVAPYWARQGRDSSVFFCGEATQLPFRSNYFDTIYSLGVIEHLGVEIPIDRWQARQRYAHELLRVLRPGGRLLLSCPNKSFPVDVQHGPESRAGWRQWLWEKSGIHLHPVWSRNHLLSYGEVQRLFRAGGAREFTPWPLRGFFGFASFRQGPLRWVRSLAEIYVHHLPGFLRATALNPYVLLEIRK